MKKKIPISRYKYNTHLSKFGRHIFGDRRRSYVSSTPRFYANRFDASSSLYRAIDKYDYDHTINKVNLSTVLSLLENFISLPEMTKTYLSKKRSNDYEINRHSAKNAYFDFDVEILNYIADNYKQEYEEAWNASINKGMFNNYMHRNILRKEGINYSANLRQHFDETSEKIIGPLKFNLYDNNHISLLKENLLNLRLTDSLFFTIEATKEVCVSKFNDFSFSDKESYYKPTNWGDDNQESHDFFTNHLSDASRNATIVQCVYEVIFRTVNLRTFKHNMLLPTKQPTDYNPLNFLSLSYFFYEIADYKEFI